MENMLDKHSNPFQLVSHVNWLELSGKKIFFKIISMKVKQSEITTNSIETGAVEYVIRRKQVIRRKPCSKDLTQN